MTLLSINQSKRGFSKSLGIRNFLRVILLVYFLLAFVAFLFNMEPSSFNRLLQSLTGLLLLQGKVQSLLFRQFYTDTSQINLLNNF
ncbi:hypothetical protein B9P99_06450 [Candidatus Marsarchaeota G1 archaeon OSP_B]|uniref:Uncharacterized protein n=5 Tax=Candidatus Marsarchaeota TaxID=1978152 RepID=A0A2R6AEW8_9ARCH|nr:MAG: hypothetical protein B9Q01_03010 [Candidatus Marsarchaeota G1 archaeon OSP_D]PSN84920.1 MAG: hypothetical protein B9Q02_08325 [Candidatus Marsarchaeota G1 archaeon BE_D]PSN87517.1 MAG: hypothetical protein B9P99_06450 [Candidatus Marsarchaeota G1 archaeon OSP_B]PSN88642.1 MAG: hypothetical protein B9Q00_04650 [Candidatus Marsarchaeota G1 archaeon OSP_C]PSO01927.1 MAG: hypothetical protein B9Q10_01940 [Candidatus Marsarchaeota G2 archaeon ECH_B_SAG-E12]